MRLVLQSIGSLSLLLSASAASAAISDPTSDFLLTYTGPANADVDIVSADVAFNGKEGLIEGRGGGIEFT